MRTVNAIALASITSGAGYTPALSLACGALTIDQLRIQRLEIHEIGRLGLANLTVEIDNQDGGAAAFAAAVAAAPFTSADGLVVGGVTYLNARGTWWVTRITPGAISNQRDGYTIEAQNAWSRFKVAPLLEDVYLSTPLGDLLAAAFLGSGGDAISTDESSLFLTPMSFTFPAGFPYQPLVGILAGVGSNAQARVYGRFSASADTWLLFGGQVAPTAAGAIGGVGETRVRTSAIGDRACTNEIDVYGGGYAAGGAVTQLAGAVNADRAVCNTVYLTTLARVQARLAQEVIEQIEVHTSGDIETDYDPRWEQWDYVALSGAPEVVAGTVVRVAEVHLTYRAGHGYKQVLHVRVAALDVTTTPLSPLGSMPAITGLTGVFNNDDLVLRWDALDRIVHQAFLYYEVAIDGVIHLTADSSFVYAKSLNISEHGGYDVSLDVSVCAFSRVGLRGLAATGTYLDTVYTDAGGSHELLFATGVTPPDPVISSGGVDWLYSSS